MKPANVQTGLVTGRFIVGVADGPDEGQEPDFIAAVGRILFVASVPYLPDPTADPAPVTLLQAPVVGVLDHEGYLCTVNEAGGPGERGIRLIATDDPDLLVQEWTWNVKYTFETVNGVEPRIEPHAFFLPSDAAVDLTTLVKVPSSPGLGLEQVEAAVLRAEEEAAKAQLAANESAALVAQTFVAAEVQGDDLVLTRDNGETVVAGDVRGAQGLPGPNTIPTMEAVATAIGTEASVARAAVEDVVDGRKVGTPNLYDDAVSTPKIVDGAVTPAKLGPELVTQFEGYEQDILARPTEPVVSALANAAADLSRSSTAVITTGAYGGANYKLTRVIGATGKPGLIGKRFGQDYTSGTPGDGFTPPTETLTSVFQRTGADIVLNGGGWVVEPGNPRDGFMDGCQILNGVLYRDFNPSGSRGRDAIGIHYDGSIGLYSAADGDTGQQMIDAGVQHSFSFGPALVKAGVAQAVDATTISGRQILAATTSGDLLIITVTGATGISGLSYQQCADLAVSLGALFAVPMDGGGSAQTLVQGNWVNPSSDPATQRATIDFLTIHAKIVGDTASTWHPLATENGFTSSQAAVRQHNGVIEFRGSLTHATATGTVQASSLPWWARPDSHQRIPATINLTAGQFYDFEVGGALKMNSSVANGGPRYISFVNYPAKPI